MILIRLCVSSKLIEEFELNGKLELAVLLFELENRSKVKVSFCLFGAIFFSLNL